MHEKLFKLYGVDVGDVDEIPVGSNLEGNKFFCIIIWTIYMCSVVETRTAEMICEL